MTAFLRTALIFMLGAVLIALVAMLTGCAKPRFPNEDTAQFRRDAYACQRDAQLAHPPFGGFVAGVITGARQQALFRQCMEAQGY